MSTLPSDELPVDQSDDPIGPLRPYSPEEDRKLSWGRRTESQRLVLRWLAALIGFASGIYLLVLFGVFICALLHVVKESGHIYARGSSHVVSWPFDWHLVFLGSLMVVPATLIILVLSKHAFSDGGGKDNSSIKDLPLIQLIEAVIDGLKSLFKKD